MLCERVLYFLGCGWNGCEWRREKMLLLIVKYRETRFILHNLLILKWLWLVSEWEEKCYGKGINKYFNWKRVKKKIIFNVILYLKTKNRLGIHGHQFTYILYFQVKLLGHVWWLFRTHSPTLPLLCLCRYTARIPCTLTFVWMHFPRWCKTPPLMCADCVVIIVLSVLFQNL